MKVLLCLCGGRGGRGDEGAGTGVVQGNRLSRSTACPGPQGTRAGDHEGQVADPRDTQ